MIVREIKKDADKVLSNFDWFNDYKDTLSWCKHNCPDIANMLTLGYNTFLANEKTKQLIEKFFNEMVSECSGTDNGVDAVLDAYVVDNALRPFKDYYLTKLTQW